MNGLQLNRKVADCFYLAIPLYHSQQELEELIRNCIEVEKSVQLMLKGEINPDDFLDIVEGFIPSMDDYIEEIEENLVEVEEQLIYLA